MWVWTRGSVQALALLFLAVSSLALVACGDDPAPKLIRPTPTAPAAVDETPDTQGRSLPLLAPDELSARLVGGNDPLSGLSPLYAIDTTEIVRSDAIMQRLDRGVRFTLKGPDRTNVVTFYVFKSAEDARNDMSAVAGLAFRPETVDGLGYPTRQVVEQSSDKEIGTTRVLVLVGQTVIESTSTLGLANPGGSFEHAKEVAIAAIAYLEAAAQR